MTSILTNVGAMVAIQTLRALDSSMQKTQGQVSSGLRVASASDNAAYWSISTTMRSDNMALSAVKDALGLGAAKVDVAYAGMEAAVDVMNTVKAKLVAAREAGVDKTKIDEELTQLKDQLRSIAASASFSGENWLWMQSAEQDGPKQVPGAFVRDASGNVSVNMITYDMTSDWDTTRVFYLIDDLSGDSGIITNSAFADELGLASDWVLFNGENHQVHPEISLSSATTDLEVDEMILVVEAMIAKMVDVASTLGALQSRIDMQTEFAAKLSDAIDSGIGRLVDADMNEASTRLKAVQTQQQLAIQSLSVANAAPETMLQLFR
ncbi:flagellin N-terminal helical domain-containing protein [Mycoplana ramosa]|uniref:Flagellin n=1 Tax=Mycoplana ramosa TaxID=40837 RepID=A0ABW3YWB3_MYCRA